MAFKLQKKNRNVIVARRTKKFIDFMSNSKEIYIKAMMDSQRGKEPSDHGQFYKYSTNVYISDIKIVIGN